MQYKLYGFSELNCSCASIVVSYWDLPSLELDQFGIIKDTYPYWFPTFSAAKKYAIEHFRQEIEERKDLIKFLQSQRLKNVETDSQPLDISSFES